MMTDELHSLRAMAKIPQESLSKIIGVSRQTYGAFERKQRTMSWDTCLSLLFFFYFCEDTREYLRIGPAFPGRLINRMNNPDRNIQELPDFPRLLSDNILSALDEKALHTLKTVLIMEYSRCSGKNISEAEKVFTAKNNNNVL